MTDEEKKVETGEQVGMEQDYLAAINELKNNTVPRQDFEQLKAENKKLLDAVVNGQQAPKEVEQEVVVNLDELRNELFHNDKLSNLEYVQNALLLRDELIRKGAQDPFLPCGDKTLPTDDDRETAERVASVLKECVEIADGDSQIFTNELQRRTVDTAPRKFKR